jgi:phospholipase C
MALSFFIQEGVVSTGIKKGYSLAQLFDVTRWLKFALQSLGVAQYDPCATDVNGAICSGAVYAAAIANWTTSTRPTPPVSSMTAYGFNKTTGKMEVYYISAAGAPAAWYTQVPSTSGAFTSPV